MGLTCKACGRNACASSKASAPTQNTLTIALAGNPNTGKSTIFNTLTGLNQHTGNWPGKTVLKAEGFFTHKDTNFNLVDLPGTYSLLASSVEEQVARDYLCFEKPHATIVVTDATCLERNLNLALQVLEITSQVVVCVNLIDEAKRKNIMVDTNVLARQLCVPVVATAAREGRGIAQLLDVVYDLAHGNLNPKPRVVTYDADIEARIIAITNKLKPLLPPNINLRWLSLRILEGDAHVLEWLEATLSTNKQILPGKGDVAVCTT